MAPRTWLSQDQQAFVLTYQEKFLECKKTGNYTGFWPPFFEKWEENWPIIIKDAPLDPEVELEEIGKAREALQTVILFHQVLLNYWLIARLYLPAFDRQTTQRFW